MSSDDNHLRRPTCHLWLVKFVAFSPLLLILALQPILLHLIIAEGHYMPCSKELGRVVQKPINANPGSKVNRSNNSSSPIMISTAYSLCSLRLLKLKAEGQTI